MESMKPQRSAWFWPLITLGTLIAVVLAGVILALVLGPVSP